ncbi:4-amino-4-deoxy-L-arabinose transferase and related glycosyltransferases of PMT family [Paramagnetospirillum magnetotacticum MS-1]|uniref:4-amino-4-deoxy-L-arabinose transferase and related glycosyltransferases of PMT family n=1 Tax=Paramagnetospirillum magnetotacticum MS-1 TaxID=272627 RepID=A0A0C2U9E8_PARME|nr:glycosyltransferase family 39 protein [Paramagnetospirillum magnetotacticum]KIL98097.1 4-amino-4-deoxy-L-arabinose transferase and related glycosyltransferases of PMT family [Paramagnetospirillum magnetotacticum MS-1]
MDRLTGGIRPYLLLSLLSLFLYLPGLVALPPMDRDESRFVQATRQMLETGDYIRIQFQQEMRAKKPVGAYWLQAASVSLLSDKATREVWPYRLPSALAAWGAVLMTFAFGQYLFGRQTALIGAALLASSLMLVSEGHQAKTDAIMLACTVAAQGALARFYLGARGQAAIPGALVALVFWVAMGVSVLVKGPVIPAISILTILALGFADRQWAWLVGLRPFTGMIVAASIAAPWFVAISNATGGAFVGEAVKGDLLPKLLGAQESHGGWPGTYLALAAVILWPGSLLLWPALSAAWKVRLRPEIRFCLAWIIPAWVMFEIVPTKLPHYVLPTFPALALLMAVAVVGRAPDLRSKPAKIWYWLWCAIGLALAAAVVIVPYQFAPSLPVMSIPSALMIAGAVLAAAWLAVKERMLPAVMALVLTAVTSFQVVFEGVLPSLDYLFVSRQAAELVASRPHSGAVVVAGYAEPSLVFLLGTDTVLTSGENAAQHLTKGPAALSLVSDREEEKFFAAAATLGVRPVVVGMVKGFNYSRGRKVTLTAYAVEGKAP